MDLLNKSTGTLEPVEQDKLPGSLGSGKYDLVKGSSLDVINPNGELVSIPAEQAHDALLRGGYRIPTSTDLVDFENKIKYGEGFGNEAKAFGEAAARTATFGLSDYIGDPEAKKLRKELNPNAALLGDIAGVAGSLLVPSPVGLVSKATGLIAKEAAPITSAAAKFLANPETSPIAAKVLDTVGKASAHALGSAVEGAAYGAGQVVSEHALGDPDLNAEKVLTTIGNGAALGALLGGGLKFAEVAVPASLKAAKEGLGSVYEKLVGAPGEEPGLLTKGVAKASSFVSGKDYNEILDVAKERLSSLNSIEEQQKYASNFAEGLQNQWKKIGDAVRVVNKDIRPGEIEASLKEMPKEVAANEFIKVGDSIEKTIANMEERAALYPPSAIAKVKALSDDFLKQVNSESSSADIFNSINEFKRNLSNQTRIFERTPSPEWKEAGQALKGLYTDVRKGLENENVWGAAASRQAAYNDALSTFLTLTKTEGSQKGEFVKNFMSPYTVKGGRAYRVDPNKIKSFLRQLNDTRGDLKTSVLGDYFEAAENLLKEMENTYASVPNKTFNKQEFSDLITKNKDFTAKAIEQTEFNKSLNQISAGAHNVPLFETHGIAAGAMGHPVVGAVMEAWNLLKGPGLAVQRLAKIERAVQKTSATIEKGASAIFNPSMQGLQKLTGAGVLELNKEDQKKELKKVSDKLTKINSDPQEFLDKSTKAVADLHDHAPTIAQGMQLSMQRAASFLDSKLPRPIQITAMSPPVEPNHDDIIKFDRYYQTVKNPTSVLAEIKNGSLRMEHLEALSTVYPKLYEDMKMSVMKSMTQYMSKKDKPELPFKTKLALSMFLDENLYSSLQQQTIAANQQSIAATQMNGPGERSPAGGLVKPTSAGAGKVTLSERSQTNVQAVAGRE